jgi:HEAT repeat protein
VQELADLKRYVVNRLIEETNHPDGKVRLTALKSLGEVDGVDAFKKRTEITIKQQSIEEVEAELLATIAKLEQRTIDLPMVEEVEDDEFSS